MIGVSLIEQKLTLDEFLTLPETKPAQEYFNNEFLKLNREMKL